MIDTNTGTFSPDEVISIVSFRGVDHVIGGYSEGTFITAERTEPSSVSVSTVRGASGRIKRNIKRGTITISLNSMSSSNDVLNQLFILDEENNDSTGFFTLSIADKTGRSWLYGRECYISLQPAMELSTEEATKSWEITCGYLEMSHGGNAAIPLEIVTQLQNLGMTIVDRWIQ